MSDMNRIDHIHDSIDDRITELVQRVRQSQELIAEQESHIQQAKEALAVLLTERGSNWKDDAGYARLLSEGTRVVYDISALDDLIIHDPLRYGWLRDYRTEMPIASRIQVK